jgi:four helix bundle protein
MAPRVRNYRDLIVWQRSVELVTSVYVLTGTFSTAERFGLVSQLRRAAVSVAANIAEGHGRASRGEYLNQLSVARGSVNELETLCIVSSKLRMAPPSDLAATEQLIVEVRKMIVALQHALRRNRQIRP